MCNDPKKPSASRRSFLGSALTVGAGSFFFDPVRAVTEGIADSLIMKAFAESKGINATRNYINIQLPGAPIRYQFDQFLKTNKNESLQLINGSEAPMTCNAFEWASNGNVKPVMKYFTASNGLMVPHLWGQSVLSSAGANRPLTDLLKHMLVIRGYGSGLDGHQFNILAQQSPIGGVSTVTGLVAEELPSTFDSIQFPDRGGNGTFFSNKGKSQTKITGNAPLTSLMEGFGEPVQKLSKNLKAKHADAMALAQARLKAYARSDNTGNKIVGQNLTNATDMMAKGVGNLSSFYTAAVTKYQNAIFSSMRVSNIPGISEKAIVSDQSPLWHFGAGDTFVISKDYDVRTAIAEATIGNLAQSLAVAEYLIKEGMVASIDLRSDALAAVKILKKEQSAVTVMGLPHDMHASGANSVILFMNAYYRGLTAGLLEFINAIGDSAWQNTVIQIQGDFGRTARSGGNGSDHGYDQMVTSVFSGAFNNGPVVVGNIKQAGHNTSYAGTQGIATTISGYNQKGAPTPAMAAATVTALLGTSHNPYANTAAPLVSLSGGTLTAIAPGKIVA